MIPIREQITKLFELLEEHRISNAAIKLIPYVGDAIDEVLHGGSVEELIAEVADQSESRQEEIIRRLDALIKQSEKHSPIVVCVGGGNAEEILKLDEDMVIGDKHSVVAEELIGGSGVNHALRLINAGFDVFPILAIGNDRIGRSIRDELLAAAKASKVSSSVSSFLSENDDAFFDPNMRTSSATIIVRDAQRTIFTQKLRNGKYFINHLKRRIEDALNRAPYFPSALMIGHLHSDSEHVNPESAGECTKYLIDRFKGRSLIYSNFGKSQISLGLDFWRDVLPHIDVFQLNLSEAKDFFSTQLGKIDSLLEIVDIIRKNNMTAVITLDRFGAIGIHKEEPESIFLSWPLLEVKDVVDPTGAGDAFAAGMVASLSGQDGLPSHAFQNAIGTARLWAAYACGTYGGAGHCPSQKTLDAFKEKTSPRQRRAVEVRYHDFAGEIMTVLDIAFQ